MTRKTMIVLMAFTFACTGLLLMASCAKKQVKVEPTWTETEEEPPAPTVEPRDLEAERRAEEERLAREREREKAERLRQEVRSFESENIYFDFDKSELKPEARAILVKKAEWLRLHPEFSVRIAGNCDERGTNEYNLALGDRRANAAMKFLNALGITEKRMSTISYGEERPLDPGHNEDAWAKNRNDQFKLIE